MKIYPKILLITLPLIILPALLVGIVSYQVSQSAIRAELEDVLGIRLTQALEISIRNEAVLREYGLENVASNVAKAQAEATAAIREIYFGETGYVFVIDSQGVIHSHPDTNLVGQDVSGEVWYQEIANAEKGNTGYVWQEESRLAAFEHYAPWDWYIISSGAESELLGSINQLGTYTLALLVVSLLIATVALLLLARWLTAPIHALIAGSEEVRRGKLETQIPVTSRDEIGVLTNAFNDMTGQIREMISTLEQRITDRTRALETSADVSRHISTILDRDQLVKDVVEQLVTAFDYYYAHIYLFDKAKDTLVMMGGTGEAGQTMLARGHTIAKGRGLVGLAAERNTVVLVGDTLNEEIWLPNELLPETRSEIAVPIAIGDEVLGVFDVQHNVVNGLTEEDADLLQSIAGQVAVAIQNARSFAETQEQAERLAALNELSEQLTNAENLDEILHTTARYMQRIVPADRASITQLAEDRKSLEVFALQGDAGAIPTGTRLPLAGTAVGTAYTERRVVLIGDITKSDYLENTKLTEQGLKSTMSVPLLAIDQALGTLNFSSLTNNAFDNRHRDLAIQAASLISGVIENQKLFAQTQKRAAELATVAEVGTTITNILDPQEMLQMVADLSKERFDLYHAHIYLIDQTEKQLELVAGAGEVGRQMVEEGWQIPLDVETSLVAQAAHERQGVIVNDVRADPNWLPNELLPDTHSEMSIPMVVGNQVLGVLDVQSSEVNHFTSEDISIQTTLASQVAVALQNARTYAQTQKQAEHEAMINIISQRIQGTTSVENALQVAIRELGRALGAKRTNVQLGLTDDQETR